VIIKVLNLQNITIGYEPRALKDEKVTKINAFKYSKHHAVKPHPTIEGGAAPGGYELATASKG
jgi:hypothetical protein